MMLRQISPLLIGCFLAIATLPLLAETPDEGMWTFDNPPLKQLKERYNFEPTQEWLDHVRLSSVRFNDGGSGAFISADGLVMTNHHVGLGQIQKLSTAERDIVKNGYYATTLEEELQCADLELNVLYKMTNVTERVNTASKDKSPEEGLAARRQEIALIEKEATETDGLRSNVVPLYSGGEYWLYQYKKYTDVRLVFAPEEQMAAYGGDLDNFTYPRYCLDVAFFRVYEDDKPVKPSNYFKWKTAGPEADELVFVPGNPGRTERLLTYAQLEFYRDHQYPLILDFIDNTMKNLETFASVSEEQERQVKTQIRQMANAQKAYTGMYEGLLDDKIMEIRRTSEIDFRQKITGNPELKAKYGDPWETIATLYSEHGDQILANRLHSTRSLGMLSNAIRIVRHAIESEKPDGERLNGYNEAQIKSMEMRVVSPAPIYVDQQKAAMMQSMMTLKNTLGDDDPMLKILLDGNPMEKAADKMIDKSKLADVEKRKELWQADLKKLKKSKDPLIKAAFKMDKLLRQEKEWFDANVAGPKGAAEKKIAEARFAAYGKSTYPDATFTLRLSYGAVKGFAMNGTQAPPFTTLYGLYNRAHGFGEANQFDVLDRYWDRKDKLKLSTRVNFVSTNDVIGGNSGSPLINREAEIVGLIFDGNIHSLVGNFVYDEETNRSVSVHPAYIIEALRKLYDAEKLADEIEGNSPKAMK
ncbi:MAG: S46 family peptidase [Calditrichia bacterium]